MKRIIKHLHLIFISFFMLLLAASCDSNLNENIKDDPYGGGKEPLGVGLSTDVPSPSSAYPGDTVVFKAKGFLNWCDPQSGRYDFEFYISDERAEIVTATDSTITVKVPNNLSSGIAYVLLQDQVFYGPRLTILGNIAIDNAYLFKGASGPIYDCVEHYSKPRIYYPVGSYIYAYYNETSSQRFTCISMVMENGTVSGKWVTDFKLDPGQGAGVDRTNPGVTDEEVYINSFNYFPSDHTVLLSGKFTTYGYGSIPVNNITVATSEVGSSYTAVALPSKINNATRNVNIPNFNGGTLEAPVRTFVTSDENVIAVGNITNYCTINTEKSYAEQLVLEYTKVASVLRMSKTGELDTGYRKDAQGVIGSILDAAIVENDGIVVVGTFNSFDGQAVSNIVKLDSTGALDVTFMANIGSGANSNINKIRYNKTKKKILITGEFSEFNGIPAQGLVMLNDDGTRDETFNVRAMEGGLPNFAYLLDGQSVIAVSGTFTKYDGVTRQGFLLLNLDGTAMQQFNVPGIFQGELYKVIEGRTSTDSRGLLLLGDFTRFDGQRVQNAVMLEIDFD
jgi:hypothetical protein